MEDVITMSAAKACSCACANIRQTDLVVTQFYDGMLAPGGLYAIQFGLLGAISNLAPVTLNQLAQVMDMDRATLARHLKVLADRELICYEEEQPAGRVLLTPEGKEVFKRAWPLWEAAQEYIEQNFGQERFKTFLGELAAIRTVLSAGIS